MEKGSVAPRVAGLPLPVVLLMLLLAGCAPRFGGPAPVVNGAELSPIQAQIVIEPGQTLSGIAHHYHVPLQVIAEANHLAPPYRILAGGTLLIPGGTAPGTAPGEAGGMAGAVAVAPAPPIAEAPVATASPSQLASREPPSDAQQYRPVASGQPSLSPRPEIGGPAAPDQQAGRVVALDRPPPASEGGAVTPPGGPAASEPAEAPRPTPAKPAAAGHPPSTPNAVALAEPPPGSAPAARRGGTFLWPVRGRILENYGAGPDGTHNDGINIAAPRGAPVQATDAGVVAYAGNELRGYGNLILIKHPNGWISAYAHCDLILVRTGQKVVRGQVIARVGSTGNVSAPQLHFELRRGKRPVDPRDYLAPLPSAAGKAPHAG